MAAPSKAETELRVTALDAAIRLTINGSSVGPVELATSFYAFLSGDDSAPTTTRASSKIDKAAALDTANANASSPSSDKPAVSTVASTADEKPKSDEATQTTKSPSDAAGFAEDGSEITKEHVTKAAMGFVSKLGQPAFVEKLAAFGAANISGLAVSDYAKFIADLEATLALS
jgi:hypothetical protein